MTLDKMFLDSDPAQLDSSFPTSFFFNCYIYLFIFFIFVLFVCAWAWVFVNGCCTFYTL